MGDFVPTRSARAAREAEVGTAAPMEPADRIIREPECKRRSGLSRATRWRLERDGNFPRRRRISPGASGWLESEFTGWLRTRGLA
jgi:prophage regulatory protein